MEEDQPGLPLRAKTASVKDYRIAVITVLFVVRVITLREVVKNASSRETGSGFSGGTLCNRVEKVPTVKTV